MGFFQKLKHLPGIDQVCITTNGVLLRELAPAMYNAGVRHLNGGVGVDAGSPAVITGDLTPSMTTSPAP